MKSCGIIRSIDKLGRIVVPRELHKTIGITIGTPMEIFTEGESIILKQYKLGCTFCNEVGELTEFKGKAICECCMGDLRSSEVVFSD